VGFIAMARNAWLLLKLKLGPPTKQNKTPMMSMIMFYVILNKIFVGL
jgi:hypothetical protein